MNASFFRVICLLLVIYTSLFEFFRFIIIVGNVFITTLMYKEIFVVYFFFILLQANVAINPLASGLRLTLQFKYV